MSSLVRGAPTNRVLSTSLWNGILSPPSIILTTFQRIQKASLGAGCSSIPPFPVLLQSRQSDPYPTLLSGGDGGGEAILVVVSSSISVSIAKSFWPIDWKGKKPQRHVFNSRLLRLAQLCYCTLSFSLPFFLFNLTKSISNTYSFHYGPPQ